MYVYVCVRVCVWGRRSEKKSKERKMKLKRDKKKKWKSKETGEKRKHKLTHTDKHTHRSNTSSNIPACWPPYDAFCCKELSILAVLSTNLLTVITFNFPLISYNLILKQCISYNWSNSNISPMSCLSISSHLISKMTYCNSCWNLLCFSSFSLSHFLHLLINCKSCRFKNLK